MPCPCTHTPAQERGTGNFISGTKDFFAGQSCCYTARVLRRASRVSTEQKPGPKEAPRPPDTLLGNYPRIRSTPFVLEKSSTYPSPRPFVHNGQRHGELFLDFPVLSGNILEKLHPEAAQENGQGGMAGKSKGT